MLRGNDGISGLDEGLGNLTVLEVVLCAQYREVKARHFDPRHVVSCRDGTLRIRVGECVAEALAAWIGWPWIIATRRGMANVPHRWASYDRSAWSEPVPQT